MAAGENKVIVAMSGGVDSSVAAALLRREGLEVTGLFLRLEARGTVGCGGGKSEKSESDARKVAQKLGFNVHIRDFSARFAGIIDDFVAAYRAGRTPNPCILCNARIKFAALIRAADELGARWIATGHHARVVHAGGRAAVARARDHAKDQSYALFQVPPEVLSRSRFPIGGLHGKREVRKIARDLGLEIHDKPDSQEACFAQDGHVALLRRLAPEALTPGDIVDSGGAVIGKHEGYAKYTIGQRRGVGVAAGVPIYVTEIDPDRAQVTVGPKDEVLSRRLWAKRATWAAETPERFEATVQIRYNHRGELALVTRSGEGFRAEFAAPVPAVTPGQAAVVYDGERVLGGGWIVSGG